MKNQYFGDVNDYRKYGLLRILQSRGKARLLVAWMLTPNDKRRDGSLRNYVEQPKQWRDFDPELYDRLTVTLKPPTIPRVSLIEKSELVPRTTFYNKEIKDTLNERNVWMKGLMVSACKADLVFFDPDNGIEVQSILPGRKNYSKYVAKNEIKMVWDVGCSILIYQHFPRKPHHAFALSLISDLKGITRSSFIQAFSASRVLYLLITPKRHLGLYGKTISSSLNRWKGQIELLSSSPKKG
jgi:hypothetical protein